MLRSFAERKCDVREMLDGEKAEKEEFYYKRL